MIGGGALSGSEGQAERSNPFLCKQCGDTFVAKNRNGIPKEFCGRVCKTTWHNRERLRLFKDRQAKKEKRKGPSKHAEQVSRFVFLNMVPVEQRADLLREAAQHLGITDEGEVLKALRRNGCAPQQEASRQYYIEVRFTGTYPVTTAAPCSGRS